MNQPLPTISVASDVRRLIKQVESGNAFDIEFNAHAFDVQESVSEALQARLSHNDLQDDVSQRIDHFARSAASAQMYARLVINDEMPDLPDYDPCHVSVYDGIQEAGTDFSKVIQRSTIYGTVMTSVNVTDLRAYFESGRKRHLLLYLGSDRNADMKALDKMLAALPAILAAAGMDAATIKQVIAAIKAGNVPPALMKMIQIAIKLADLKAMPSTPDIKAQMAQLQKEFTAVVTRSAPMLATIIPAFAKIVAALKTFASDAPRIITPQTSLQVSTPERVTVRANNDNRMEVIKPVEVARAAKAEAISIAGPVEKSPSFNRNVFASMQTVLRQTLGIIVAPVVKIAAPILDKIIPARAPIAPLPVQAQKQTQVQAQPIKEVIVPKALMAEVKPLISTSTLAPTSVERPQQGAAPVQQVQPTVQQATPIIITAIKMDTLKPVEVVRSAVPAETTRVEKAEARPIEAKTKSTGTGPCGEFCRCASKGSVVLENERGETKAYTALDVQKNADEHEKITQLIKGREPKEPEPLKWNEDLARTFAHECGPGCNHGAPIVTGETSVVSDIEIKLKTVEPQNQKNAPAWIGKRTVRPA